MNREFVMANKFESIDQLAAVATNWHAIYAQSWQDPRWDGVASGWDSKPRMIENVYRYRNYKRHFFGQPPADLVFSIETD